MHAGCPVVEVCLWRPRDWPAIETNLRSERNDSMIKYQKEIIGNIQDGDSEYRQGPRDGRRRGAGRPLGSRNKATLACEAGAKTLTELAQEKTEDALTALEAVMNHPFSPALARPS